MRPEVTLEDAPEAIPGAARNAITGHQRNDTMDSTTDPTIQGRVSRQWTGVVLPSRAEAYLAHLRSDTFPRLREIPGFLDARILRREVDGGTEFRVVTEWASMEAVGRFAGPDPEAAVVPAEVREMLVHFDRRVRHYELVQGGPA